LFEQVRNRPRLGLLLLMISWLCGSGAANLGLLREGGNTVAIPIFLIACLAWWVAFELLFLSGRILCFALLGLWTGGLVVAATAAKEHVYNNIFWVVSSCAVILLIALSTLAVFKNRTSLASTKTEWK
jgi:sulfite exporter TauE/SafE